MVGVLSNLGEVQAQSSLYVSLDFHLTNLLYVTLVKLTPPFTFVVILSLLIRQALSLRSSIQLLLWS